MLWIACKRGLWIGRTLWQFLVLQTAEGLLNHWLGGFCIEITYDDKCHIVRHIPCVVEFDEFAEAWVLQVLWQTNHIALVWVTSIEFAHQLFAHVGVRIILVHIILLKHVLQLCLESTIYRVNHTVREDGQPLVHAGSRERVVIYRHIVAGTSVHACSTDSVEQYEEVLYRSVFSGFDRCFVDLGGEFSTLCLIGSLCILIVEANNLLVVGFLFLPIECTDFLCTLEEHMFQVVSQTSIFCWFVHCTCTHGHIARYVRLVVIFPEHNGQTIIQFIFG